MTDPGFCVRPITYDDRQMVANLIHFEQYVHCHLDWRPPLDWIDRSPYLVGTKNGKIEAVLACPANPPEIAWIRLFAVSSYVNLQDSWEELWSSALADLWIRQYYLIAAIPLHNWFKKILQENKFKIINQVVTLVWESDRLPDHREVSHMTIREMTHRDLPGVASVDVAAFSPLWCYAQDTLALAFDHTIIASVAEVDDLIVGYQISTVNHSGGHLARLAVLPGYQGQGIGYQLLRDELDQFQKRGIHRITVNTQQDNLGSLALYEHTGFKSNGENYPVFQYQLIK